MNLQLKKILKKILFIILLFLLLLGCFLFIGKSKPAENITWGVIFSQKYSEELGLDWKENYLAILDDLKVKNLKLVAYWDIIEKEQGIYDFEDLDWQIDQAQKREAEVLLVIGRRVPRWPECHIPNWAKNLEEKKQEEEVLNLITQIVLRYKDNETIKYWQVENEPFFPFGKCPPFDKKFLEKEINLVRYLDPERKLIISETGEYSSWFKSAKYGDIVGHTLYRKVWFMEIKRYVSYRLIPPVFYNRKAWLIDKLFHKKVICIELQAEPWGPEVVYLISLDEQNKTMNIERFKDIIEFSRNTGIDTFYLWGAEWWYWMKEKHNDSQIWDESKNLFISE